MPVDPCLPVPIGGVAPHPSHPYVHRVHHIIGRIRHGGTMRHVGGVKRAVAPLDGCGKVPPSLAGALPGDGKAAPASFLPKIVPAVATGGALIGGGSGVIGGFGGGGGGGVVTPPGGGGGGGHNCVGVCCQPNCGSGTPVPEPASVLLLGLALVLVTIVRVNRARA